MSIPKAYIRCMGGKLCNHAPDTCTADPGYQAEIAAARLKDHAMTNPDQAETLEAAIELLEARLQHPPTMFYTRPIALAAATRTVIAALNRPTITPAEPLCVVCHTHCGWGGIPANCAAWGKRVPATCSADVERLTRIIETLWDIIDDIDTADDIAKSDDAAYRAIVQRLQAKRWKTGITTDGQTLTIPEGALTGQPVTPTEDKSGG